MIRRATVFVALALCACQSVPDVVYPDGGSIGDADNTCPTQVPSFANVCCGPVACSGPNCAATCNDCMLHCTIFELCCPNAQNRAVCRSDAQACP